MGEGIRPIPIGAMRRARAGRGRAWPRIAAWAGPSSWRFDPFAADAYPVGMLRLALVLLLAAPTPARAEPPDPAPTPTGWQEVADAQGAVGFVVARDAGVRLAARPPNPPEVRLA
ncbi:MAG: hypothetical protein P3B98_12500, partial [Gemmatimonadota bacterium]|nr:hypothetical protein [Gemmatimonadota bacterium]